MERVGLLWGVVPVLVPVLGLLALLWLLTGPRKYLTRMTPAVLAGTALLTGLVWFLTEKVWNTWGSPLPKILYVWAWLTLAGLVLAGVRLCSSWTERKWVRGCLSAVAGILTVLAAATLTNTHFGQYPTLGTLFGNTSTTEEPLAQMVHDHPGPAPKVSAPTAPGQSPSSVKEADWNPPPDMPLRGKIAVARIPGTVSGLASSEAYIYLPPAYLVKNRPNLPVLVLLHGVPGGSRDWIDSGQITSLMDAYTAQHKGLSPVIVMPDAGGNFAPNPPLCLDTKFGNSATYLSRDVPEWIKNTLGVGGISTHQWAVAGFSYGGTCALQLGINFPDVYPTFIDISGEYQPSINEGHAALVRDYFNGDEGAFARQNAVDVVRTRKYPDTAARITIGSQDSFYRPQGQAVFNAAQAAGLNVQLAEVPGGHTWQAWRAGLVTNLDWLMGRLGIVR